MTSTGSELIHEANLTNSKDHTLDRLHKTNAHSRTNRNQLPIPIQIFLL